ncbi:MAG TPA: hypothetical protein VGD10_00845 [Allosphingosinicella sp.]
MNGDYRVEDEEDFETPQVVEQQRAIEATFGTEPESPLSVKVKKPALPEPEPEVEAAAEEELVLDPPIEAEAEVEAAPEPLQQEEQSFEPIRLEAPAPVAKLPKKPRGIVSKAKEKAAFTLRLDGNRHLKLRLACAVSGRSAQQLVTEALDELLQSLPEVEALAEQLPAKKARN